MFGSTNTFGQSSSSLFGSSQSVFGKQNNSSNNPFAPKPIGSRTPLGSQTGNSSTLLSSLFGSSQSVFEQQNHSSNNPLAPKPIGGRTPLGSQTGNSSTSAGLYGATQTLSPSSSNTTSSASSSPVFNSLVPAFGVSYTASFGNSGSSYGGLSCSGQKPAIGGLCSTPTQTSPFDSSAPFCASSQLAFGSTSTPAFGATSIPAFGATTIPTFVGSSGTPSAFGDSSSPAFGASSTPAFSFGSPTQAFGQSSSALGTSSPFGSTNSAFGGQSYAFGSHTPSQTFENTGIGQSEFGRRRGGSRVASYSATTQPDGGSAGQLGKFESISTMSIYNDKSHEELRWEDYQLGDKGGPLASTRQSTGMAGFKSYTTQTNAFSRLVFAQSSANPFSSTTPNSNNPFAPKTSTFSSGFGTSAPAFSSSAFDSSSTSAFGTSSSLAFGGPQIHTQAFVGRSGFVGQRGGSRVASYSATTETECGSGQPRKLESISAMPSYKDKSHEELRWEDYQLGTKAFGKSSPRPFSSSQSVFGQQNNSSNNPSASKPFSSPTPLGLQTGNSSTSAGVFGATQTLSPFSSNTTSSTSSSPAFNSSMPASGTSSIPAFGLSVFTPTRTRFASAIQPPQPAFGSNTQQSQPAFGSTSTSAFGATSTPAYAATTPAFSFRTSTQAFGQSSSAFRTSSPFGSTTSAFGGSHTPTQTLENTGIGQSEFGRQRGGSRVASYSATTEPDGGSGQPGNFESISTMSYYKDKCHEELRWEDYQLGDKGGPLASAPQSTGMAGFNSSTTQTNAFSPSTTFCQSSANPFSSTGVFCAAQTSSPFSSNTTFGASSLPDFGSSTPSFGAPSTPAFGNSSSSLFGGSSVFGQKPAFGGFGSTPTQTSPFGSATQPSQPAFGSNTQQSQPAFGSSIFGSATPFGATSQPAFGSTGIPAFGAPSTPAIGAISTPAFGTTSTPAFGATSTPAFGSTTTPAFGSTGSAFGMSNTSMFGGGAFGASSSPVFGSSSTPATAPTFSFGSSTQAFGQSSSAIGTSSPFGSTTSAFGGQSSAFGSQTPTQTFGNTGIGQSGFGGQRGGSRVASYSATTETVGTAGQSGKLESISAMPVYKDKSHEELRWEDYQLGDKGGPIASAPQSTGMVGFNSSTTQTNAFSPSPIFGHSSANPFSSTTPNSNNPFAPKASSFSSGFGTSAPAFSSSVFGSSSTSSFGTSSSFAFGASSIPGFCFGSSTKACGLSSSSFGTWYPFGEDNQFGDKDIRSSGQTEKLESISAILLYKDKSHEELRWEDYQLGSSASTNAQSGSEFGQNTFPFGQTACFRPSSFFSSLSSGLVGSIFSSSASLTSNAHDWVMSYQGRGSTVSLAVLTGTVLATVVVSGWISLRCRRA